MKYTGEQIAELLGLSPLPEEGGLWTQTYKDEHSTSIYYLLSGGEVSLFHKLPGPETYHWYMGAPAELVLLKPDGTHETRTLGTDLSAGQRPQTTVDGGIWQGSSSTGEWTLLGTTMSPPYRQEDFTLGDRQEMLDGWPLAKSAIIKLTQAS